MQCHTLHVMAEDRVQIAVRLTKTGLEIVDKYAAEEERTRSDMVRKLLSEAIQHRVAEAK